MKILMGFNWKKAYQLLTKFDPNSCVVFAMGFESIRRNRPNLTFRTKGSTKGLTSCSLAHIPIKQQKLSERWLWHIQRTIHKP